MILPFFHFSHRSKGFFRPLCQAFGMIACLFSLAACTTYNRATQYIAEHITPYRITIIQGNFVSREAVQQLQPGLSREQVKTILGTPLLTPLFHHDRWDYVFYFKQGDTQVVQQRTFTAYFDEDRLTHWEGAADLPSETELIAEIDGEKQRRRFKQLPTVHPLSSDSSNPKLPDDSTPPPPHPRDSRRNRPHGPHTD
jgi:outer membrane protein assembly factor BamE